MATKKKTPVPSEKRYIVNCGRLASDDEVWLYGAEIYMDDQRAALHMAKGTIVAADETKPPKQPEPAVTVHEPAAKETKE